MNRWALMLAELPPTLQRLIARTQRISLPRGCPAPERLVRLRVALCHGATVRATYQLLDAPAQAALQHLRTCRGGLAPDDLAARYGPIRPLSQIAAAPRPQSLSEQLLLLGWLLPRPAVHRHPPRYLLPPELRTWLPTPRPPAPVPPTPPAATEDTMLPPALRATHTLLLAAAEAPLRLRDNGLLTSPTLRRLLPRLAPLATAEAADLCQFVSRLVQQLGLLHAHQGWGQATPALASWLNRPSADQLAALTQAWIGLPTLEPSLARQHPPRRGIDLPVLRRRLLAWAAALPGATPAAAAAQYESLAAAFGPLADASTHGFRPVDRAPWQPKRAAAIWAAAVHGPLAWLGVLHDGEGVGGVGGVEGGLAPVAGRPSPVSHSSLVTRHSSLQSWHYGAPGQLTIPHVAVGGAVVALLPFVAGQVADRYGTTYTFTAASLARAASHGHHPSQLQALLDTHAGPAPVGWWHGLPAPTGTVQLETVVLLRTDQPALLRRLRARRSISRYLQAQLAPGLALVVPEAVPALQRACQQQGLVCTHTEAAPPPTPPAAAAAVGRPRPASPPAFSPAECATLLLACARARQHATAADAPLPTDALEQRLWAALPAALHASTQAALDEAGLPSTAPARAQPWTPPPVAIPGPPAGVPPPPAPVPPPAARVDSPVPLPVAALRARLQRMIRENRAITMRYRDAAGRVTTRSVRPLALEPQGDSWQLRAYCLTRQAERNFRLDRILAVQAGEKTT